MVTHVRPQRFREAEHRNRKLGRPLQLLTRTGRPDPTILETIGERLLCRDEPAAALVAAMRRNGPDKVTMGQFNQALESGIDRVINAPPALRAFFDVVEQIPGWVDFNLINEGAAAYRRLGTNAADVMLQLALIGSYRFG